MVSAIATLFCRVSGNVPPAAGRAEAAGERATALGIESEQRKGSPALLLACGVTALPGWRPIHLSGLVPTPATSHR